MTNKVNTEKKVKAKRMSPEDYIYLSSMLKTREAKRISYSALLRFADAKDVSDAEKLLSEYSIEPIRLENGAFSAEETVNSYLAKEFTEVEKLYPESKVISFLRLPYDAHNIKSAIKTSVREVKELSELFIKLGSISAENLMFTLQSGDFSAFPKNLASATPRAKEAYLQSGDPKLIDSIIDEACFADMKDCVSHYQNRYFTELVKTKADTVNITTALRIMRMGDTTGLFKLMYVSGGSLDRDFFERSTKLGEEGFINTLSKRGYIFSVSEGGKLSLSSLSRQCEAFYMKKVSEGSKVFYGPEVPVSYLIRAEYALKMLRMVFASKQMGISPDKIRENIVKF